MRVIFLVLFTFGLTQLISNPAIANIPCETIEAIGNSEDGEFLAEVNRLVGGKSLQFDPFNKIELVEVPAMEFNGCRFSAEGTLKMHLVVVDDRHGYAKTTGRISRYDEEKLCVSDLKVSKVWLERTPQHALRIYQRGANDLFNREICLDIQE